MDRKGFPSFAFEFVSFGETIKEVNKKSIIKVYQTLELPKQVRKITFWSHTLYIIILITHWQVRNTQTV